MCAWFVHFMNFYKCYAANIYQVAAVSMTQLEGLKNSAEKQVTRPSQTVNRAGKKPTRDIHIQTYIHTPCVCGGGSKYKKKSFW